MSLDINKIKYRTYEIIEQGKPGDKFSIIFDWFIIILIILNIATLIAETSPSISPLTLKMFHVFEVYSVIVFTVEYALRVWTATCNPKYRQKIVGRFKYIGSASSLIDVMAIVPFYLEVIIGAFIDLRFVRIFRLFRLFRVLRLGRYSSSIKVLVLVFKEKLADLIIAISIVFILIILSASILFYVEHTAQPESFSSIPETMWWAVCTLTTIGYGDLVPMTFMGRFMTAFIAILSIGIIALPAAMLVTGYSEVTARFKKKKHTFNITRQNILYIGGKKKTKPKKLGLS